MQKYLIPALAALCLFLVACGGEDKDPTIFDLPADKKPADISGNVEVTERTYTIKLEAPTPAYAVKITSVWVVGEEIWVVSQLSEKQGGMVAQVITEISDSVTLTLPDISPEYYVIGKQIGPDQVGVTFIDSQSAIQERLDVGEQVWPKQ